MNRGGAAIHLAIRLKDPALGRVARTTMVIFPATIVISLAFACVDVLRFVAGERDSSTSATE